MMNLRVLFIASATMLVAACGGVDEIVKDQCPEIAVLVTADVWKQDKASAQMKSVRLTCFIDGDSNELLADIRLKGVASEAGLALPFFVATLDKENRITDRLQYKVKVGKTDFAFDLPRYVYGTRDKLADRPRLVAGFVLTPAQLKANRADYRDRLGIE